MPLNQDEGNGNFERLRARESAAMQEPPRASDADTRKRAEEGGAGTRRTKQHDAIKSLLDALSGGPRVAPEASIADLVNGVKANPSPEAISTLVHKLLSENLEPRPGRETNKLTPERNSRINKMVKEIGEVVAVNMLEHGIENATVSASMITTALSCAIIKIEAIAPGAGEVVGCNMALRTMAQDLGIRA